VRRSRTPSGDEDRQTTQWRLVEARQQRLERRRDVLASPFVEPGVLVVVAIEMVEVGAELRRRREVARVDVATGRRGQRGDVLGAPIHRNRTGDEWEPELLGDVVGGDGVLERECELVLAVQRDLMLATARDAFLAIARHGSEAVDPDASSKFGDGGRSSSWTMSGSKYGCHTSLVRSCVIVRSIRWRVR
jgi:hypothetical protein